MSLTNTTLPPNLPPSVRNFFMNLRRTQNELVDQQSHMWSYDFREQKPIPACVESSHVHPA